MNLLPVCTDAGEAVRRRWVPGAYEAPVVRRGLPGEYHFWN